MFAHIVATATVVVAAALFVPSLALAASRDKPPPKLLDSDA